MTITQHRTVQLYGQHNRYVYVKQIIHCKTLNVCVPFISRISRTKQNREIKGREYQLQAKNRTKLLQYFELYGFIRQDKGAKIILHAKSPTFRAAKLQGFYSKINQVTFYLIVIFDC